MRTFSESTLRRRILSSTKLGDVFVIRYQGVDRTYKRTKAGIKKINQVPIV